MTKLTSIMLLLMGSAGFAAAGGLAPTPEINPATGIAALALLSGGLLVVRARRRK